MTEPSANATLVVDLSIRMFPVASNNSNHVMCCANGDVSLCAQDISGHNVVDTDGPSGCAVCDYLDATDFCPLGLVCVQENAE